MFFTSIKMAISIPVAIVILGAGMGFFTRQALAEKEEVRNKNTAASAKENTPKKETPKDTDKPKPEEKGKAVAELRESVLSEWYPPMGKAPHIVARASAGSKMYGATVVTSVPFKDLWLHYAKKCGCEQEYPEKGTLAGDEKDRYLIQDGVLSAGGERGTSLLCNGEKQIVSVVLVPRERSAVVVMITVLQKP